MQWLRHNWVIAVVLACIPVSFLVSNHDTQQRVQKADRDSVVRSVGTCQRGNPSRAYLLLRAEEFPTGTDKKASFTTSVSGDVYAILNCERTVAAGGAPVPVPEARQIQYLAWFKQRQVPILRGDDIVGHVPFETYFGRP